MINIFKSFYARLSLIFLLLILILGVGTLVIAFSAAEHLFDEVEQLLNREYAGSIALELQPLVEEGFFLEEIKEAIHYMMVLNPNVEIYLLSGDGLILAYFTHPAESLLRRYIDLTPLNSFIASDGRNAVLGDDPRTEAKSKPFSAAPLKMGRDTGFVYVILRGQSYDRSLEMLQSSYYLQSGLSTFFFAVMATVLAGLSLFFILTRRLRNLSTAVRAFEQGQYDYRLDLQGQDELGVLGRAFNDMAASIENGVEKLHAAEQQRSDLIANISHDLRSPLTSIRGHLETMILKDKTLSEQERSDFMEILLKNVFSFQKLVEELFDLAKLESRQVLPGREPFHMAELVQDVLLKLKPQSESLNISLIMEHEDDVPIFEGDIGMMERVLTNLLENALSHTPEGGQIRINITVSGHELQIKLNDTGPGILAEDLPHIFERFYRADKSRDRRTAGTGLGLAIVKEIIELHGGVIEAESPPDSGAVFRIVLPI
ncbi:MULTISPECIES: cell wall metabolism sensor histidine kinase WalK [unclassified Oceanispirochaeta]|uniref:sensor histidine kinase n=1 Tax=unclassified Oceanispirochaeta TaxID=2635722 RepID=UPI000E0966F6|nr:MULTISPECIES: HAMP domain-containing sensor histidine kinase [unclassified Oceanispirochaeta]MBF9017521.1 HAMP domain-containing protein [Oceanispirochaeta sp. M2]NPD74093.1 HAMP domain-containing protein [Oceanispirochaeta sp. M1]RDG30133.1 HAMP domain-containing protein [Oceanispirochaeta sp. M1]